MAVPDFDEAFDCDKDGVATSRDIITTQRRTEQCFVSQESNFILAPNVGTLAQAVEFPLFWQNLERRVFFRCRICTHPQIEGPGSMDHFRA